MRHVALVVLPRGVHGLTEPLGLGSVHGSVHPHELPVRQPLLRANVTGPTSPRLPATITLLIAPHLREARGIRGITHLTVVAVTIASAAAPLRSGTRQTHTHIPVTRITHGHVTRHLIRGALPTSPHTHALDSTRGITRSIVLKSG